jgi:archaellin
MLDPGELVTITVYLSDNGEGYYSDEEDEVHFMGEALVAGTTFCLNVIPPDGSVLPIERTIPSGVRATTGDIALVNLN